MFTVPEEGGRNAENHRASLVNRVAIVVYVSDDRAVRGDHGACSGGRDAQGEDSLTAQKLPNAGAEHLTAISLSTEERGESRHVDLH